MENEILSNMSKYKIYITIVTIGYFVSKILYNFGKFYPIKYIKRKSNDELTDYFTTIFVTSIIYVLTGSNLRSIFDINYSFYYYITAYVIGWFYPIIHYKYINDKQDNFFMKYIFKFISILLFVICIIFAFITTTFGGLTNNNFLSKNGGWLLYIIQMISIIFIIILLIITKKQVTYYKATKYNSNNNRPRYTNMIYQTSGEKVNYNLPMIVTLLSLLFLHEPKTGVGNILFNLLTGFLLGIIVSSIAYNGIEFILKYNYSNSCSSDKECARKKIPYKIQSRKTDKTGVHYLDSDENLNKRSDTQELLEAFKWILILTICCVILISIQMVFSIDI